MEVITHKCPNCDGALTFDPSDQKFHCPYCMSIFTEAEVTSYEEKQKAARLVDETVETITDTTTDSDESATMDLFSCPSCGAEIVTDSTTAATYCYFCHNPVVLTGRLSGKFLPDKVLPFAIDKEQATTQFLEWAQKKWFVPRDFFNKTQVEKLTGVYFPYWAVDATAEGELNGTGTSLRIWRVGDIEYTETKQYEVFRQGTMHFNELIKNALTKNEQKIMVESVQPFQLEQAVPFKNQYLAGFQAEKRDIEYLTLKPEIQQELATYGEELLSDSVSAYTSFSRKHRQFEVTEEDNQYVLLPVWLVTYQADDANKKTFYYAMNGQTGKVAGILPISYRRLGLSTAGIFAFLAILLMIVGYFI